MKLGKVLSCRENEGDLDSPLRPLDAPEGNYHIVQAETPRREQLRTLLLLAWSRWWLFWQRLGADDSPSQLYCWAFRAQPHYRLVCPLPSLLQFGLASQSPAIQLGLWNSCCLLPSGTMWLCRTGSLPPFPTTVWLLGSYLQYGLAGLAQPPPSPISLTVVWLGGSALSQPATVWLSLKRS